MAPTDRSRRSLKILVGPSIVFLGLALAIPGLRGADDGDLPKPDRGSEPAPASIVLFDGESLDGWIPTDFYKPGSVEVRDGAIVLGKGGSMTGITSTRRDLPRTNYELTFEAKRLEGRDFFAAATFPVGDSFITLVNGGWGGNVTGLSSLDGADASENETSRYVRYENDRWYRFRIHVTDTIIRVFVDDEELIEVDHEGRQVGTRIETRSNQPLGFATWETAGAIRNIAIRSIPSP